MTSTRPDICYAVSRLSEKFSDPTLADLNMGKYTLKYLKGTKNQGLKYNKTNNINLVGYSDSDWGNSSDRKSISGYCFRLCSGSLLSWRCKKQSIVALSTCEAEYIALTFALQEALFLKQLLNDMCSSNIKTITLFGDNQGSIELSKNPVYHQRSKHIDVRYHFIRSHVTLGNVDVKYIPTAENCADVFTKPVSKNKIKYFKFCET